MFSMWYCSFPVVFPRLSEWFFVLKEQNLLLLCAKSVYFMQLSKHSADRWLDLKWWKVFTIEEALFVFFREKELFWLNWNLIIDNLIFFPPDWLWHLTQSVPTVYLHLSKFQVWSKWFWAGIFLHTDYNQWIGMCVSSFYAESWSIFTVPFSAALSCR